MRTYLLVAPDESAIATGLAAAPDVLVVDFARAPPALRAAAARVEAAIYARVSPLRSAAIDGELARAMRLGAAGIVLSGAEGLVDLEHLGARLAVLEAEHGREDGAVRIVALVDSAAGVLALPTMRPRPRLEAIAVDPAALADRLGCGRDAPAIAQATGMTVLAAAGCGVCAAMAVDRDDAPASEAGFGAVIRKV